MSAPTRPFDWAAIAKGVVAEWLKATPKLDHVLTARELVALQDRIQSALAMYGKPEA